MIGVVVRAYCSACSIQADLAKFRLACHLTANTPAASSCRASTSGLSLPVSHSCQHAATVGPDKSIATPTLYLAVATTSEPLVTVVQGIHDQRQCVEHDMAYYEQEMKWLEVMLLFGQFHRPASFGRQAPRASCLPWPSNRIHRQCYSGNYRGPMSQGRLRRPAVCILSRQTHSQMHQACFQVAGPDWGGCYSHMSAVQGWEKSVDAQMSRFEGVMEVLGIPNHRMRDKEAPKGSEDEQDELIRLFRHVLTDKAQASAQLRKIKSQFWSVSCLLHETHAYSWVKHACCCRARQAWWNVR